MWRSGTPRNSHDSGSWQWYQRHQCSRHDFDGKLNSNTKQQEPPHVDASDADPKKRGVPLGVHHTGQYVRAPSKRQARHSQKWALPSGLEHARQLLCCHYSQP
jgi:hypothetical protein